MESFDRADGSIPLGRTFASVNSLTKLYEYTQWLKVMSES